jgi:hypothetical protein
MARLEQNVCELRRMIEELVPAQREASAMKASSSSDTTYRPSYMARPNSCLHGAPHLFTSALTPSIVDYLAFMEADGNMDKDENALWRARDSDRFGIPAAPPRLVKSWRNGARGALGSRSTEGAGVPFTFDSGVESARRLRQRSRTQ